MIKLTAVAAMVFALTACGPEVSSPQRGTEPEVAVTSQYSVNDVLAVQAALGAAVTSRDRAAADALIAEDFRAIGHTGNLVDKDTYLEIHFSPERDFTVFEGSDSTVLAIGAAHVLTGKFTIENALAEEQLPPSMITAVFADRSGNGLKIVSWQETTISKEGF